MPWGRNVNPTPKSPSPSKQQQNKKKKCQNNQTGPQQTNKQTNKSQWWAEQPAPPHWLLLRCVTWGVTKWTASWAWRHRDYASVAAPVVSALAPVCARAPPGPRAPWSVSVTRVDTAFVRIVLLLGRERSHAHVKKKKKDPVNLLAIAVPPTVLQSNGIRSLLTSVRFNPLTSSKLR